MSLGDFADEIEDDAGFRRGVARMLGVDLSDTPRDAVLRADVVETTLGHMIAVSDRHSLRLLEFGERARLPAQLKRLYAHAKGSFGFGRFGPTEQVAEEMTAFLRGTRATFEVPLNPLGTAFSKKVWRSLMDIPEGHTRSYSEHARLIGYPQATRAVARANGANPIAIVIPCHRLIGANGSLTGYGGGLWRKEALIALEVDAFASGASTSGMASTISV